LLSGTRKKKSHKNFLSQDRLNSSISAHSRLTRHKLAFWFGVIYILAGVSCHFPDYNALRGHLHITPLPLTNMMWFGMLLILVGITTSAYGLFPVNSNSKDAGAGYQLHAMDDAQLTLKHYGLVLVLAIALVVDVMKPATISFAVPGMRVEYGLSKETASLFPFSAMLGTTIGSLFWGILADKMGRRGSILLASLIFVSTGICGCMPAFRWNVAMCFFMGLSAGGMLPIVFALLAEMIPARHRGWVSVMVGGIGTAGGYLAASGAAAWLEPIYSWRILWLLNMPTGLLVILLSRFIPESPRFLLNQGMVAEAKTTLAKFDIELIKSPLPAITAVIDKSVKQLFQKPLLTMTFTVCFYGLAWGLVNWGFITWLPTILHDYLNLDSKIANRLLAKSALFAVPGCALVTALYGFWSSKRTMVLFGIGTALVLASFATFKADDNQKLFSILIILLLIGLSGMIAMLSPYSVELFPTHLRATGAGVIASSSKIGGVVGPSLVAFILTNYPGLKVPALLLALPLLLAAVTLWINGRETSGRRLEEIHEIPVSAETVK
jgi:putative MFS transporter